MKLDTPSIIAISIVVDFVLVLMLLHTWRTRTTYPGFVVWMIGTACWSVGSLLNLMLPALQPQFIPKIIGNGLIMLHPLLLYEGIRRFHGIRRRWWGTPLNTAVVAAGVFCMLYFFYVSENIVARIIAINLVAAFLFARTSIEPLFYARIRRYSMQWLLSVFLLPLIVLVFARAWYHIFSASLFVSFSGALSQDAILRWIMFYGIIAELAIAYSYLSLTTDRIEEELRNEKLKLMKTIHMSDCYQAQLQDLNSEIKSQSEVQERFLDLVSHEYRTPLAIIQTNIDIMELKERQAGQDISPTLNNMQHAVDRLVDVFDATRRRKDLGMINLKLVFDTIDVEQLIKGTLVSATSFWGDRFIFLNSQPLDCKVSADGRLLRTVLLNLLDNAAKYSLPDIPVTLHVGITGDLLEISVHNHPFAPPPVDSETLFEKFSRGSNSAGTGGTGQGLYLARGIVEQHGGSLALTVDERGDVVVLLLLPLAVVMDDTQSC